MSFVAPHAANLDSACLDQAVAILRAGGVIGLPTETVYGLAADAANAAGVDTIYRVKGRPAGHPLIVHVLDADAAAAWAHPDSLRADGPARRLMAAFWPGPLTLILPRHPDAPAHACGQQASIGLRAPSHPVARALLVRAADAGITGLAAPSANRFGRVSPTSAQHVHADLGAEVPLVLEGGPAEVGVESTIIDLTTDRLRLLRPGRIRAEQVAAVLGMDVYEPDATAPQVSGSLASHYAPRAPVVLVRAGQWSAAWAAAQACLTGPLGAEPHLAVWSRCDPVHAWRAWCQARGEPAMAMRWHALPDTAEQTEQKLYAMLRALDQPGVLAIVIEAPDDDAAQGAEPLPRLACSEWDAVLDRLRRAAVRPA